jgi:hypothetical protein
MVASVSNFVGVSKPIFEYLHLISIKVAKRQSGIRTY